MRKRPLESRDRQIRTALRAKLLRQHGADEDAFVVEELPVARGSARVDMAVINGRLEGFEIKSSLDTLDRLPRQVDLYGAALNRMTLVAAPKHLAEAMEMIPVWWTIVAAEVGPKGGITLRRVRAGRANPALCPRACASLLERDELVSLLSAHGLDRGYRTAAWADLADRVVAHLPVRAITDGVRRQLKIRTLLEARYERTVFGSTAAGGGLTAELV